jgi:hypothetical protein
MPNTLTLQLADGSTVEGVVEGYLSARAQDLLNAASSTSLRLSTEKTDTEKDDENDVEGHSQGDGTVTLLISDDVEGHAFTLRLPSAEAARDLQTKLLATGALVGVVVVGATVAQVAPDLSIGTGPAAAPAPITRSVTDDVGLMDASGNAIVGSGAVIGGAVNPGETRVDLRTGTNAAPLVPPASANPLVRDGGMMDASGNAIVDAAPLVPPASANPLVRDGMTDAYGYTVVANDTSPLVPPASADPGVRDRDGSPAPVDTAPTDTPPGGLPRAR